jgi:hypothetical protein
VEKAETGKVKMRVYAIYISSIGYWLSTCFILVYIVSSACGVGSNLWLADWSDQTAKNPAGVNLGEKLGVYTALGMSQGRYFH